MDACPSRVYVPQAMTAIACKACTTVACDRLEIWSKDLGLARSTEQLTTAATRCDQVTLTAAHSSKDVTLSTWVEHAASLRTVRSCP
jgi:hypothetical protein